MQDNDRTGGSNPLNSSHSGANSAEDMAKRKGGAGKPANYDPMVPMGTYSSIEAEMQAMMQGQPSDPFADDSGDELVNCGIAGRITTNGFFKFNQREGGERHIHPFPLWPVSIINVGVDDEIRTMVEVRFRRVQGGYATRRVSLSELSGFGKKDHPLVVAGWKPPASRNLGDVETILSFCFDKLDLPCTVGYANAGWVNEKLHLRPGKPELVIQVPGSTETKGDKEVWRETVTELMNLSDHCSLAVAVALGSLFRGVIGEVNISHIYSITGAPGTGKTTVLQAVASFAGYPNKPQSIVDGKSTARGMELQLSAANHGWLLIDEFDQALMKNADDGAVDLMFMTNGGGRVKSSQSGDLVVGKTWSTTIITTGNKSLLQLAASAKKGEALTTRIVETDIMDAELNTFPGNSAQLPALVNKLFENYGWGYPDAIENIIKNRRQWIDRFHEIDLELRSNPRLSVIFADQARLLSFFELASLGAELAGEILGPEAGACAQDALDKALVRYEQDPDEGLSQTIQRQFKLITDFRDWLAMNSGRFIWNGCAFIEPRKKQADYPMVSEEERQREQAKFFTDRALSQGKGALGVINQRVLMNHVTDFDGDIVLGPSALDELERNAKIDRDELVNALKAFDLLQVSSDGRESYKLSTSLSSKLGGGSRGLKFLIREVSIERFITRASSISPVATPQSKVFIPERYKEASEDKQLEALEKQQEIDYFNALLEEELNQMANNF